MEGSKGRIKYDWYQTEQAVVINILLKNAKDVEVTFQEGNLLDINVPPLEYSLSLRLRHSVRPPPQSYWRVTPAKIEVKCMKVEGIRWDKLEMSEDKPLPVALGLPATEASEPSSSSLRPRKNWDELASEVEKEEKEGLEGDAAVNSLFQQIYSQGDEDTKRAMIKSFYESGGTVLSTNWGEVGKDKVEVKPPEGMEFKKWDS
ncbi:unnamed protein product [Cyprideis torosa]|uniref:Uncharacterized protein n=1 Tax=Cyprideis torosa TaxID=163714 RepID=A0A7R8WEL1_9CRUS|nr:unnamed protein product [Cyprideis torosa]CAG0890450.1 unnamed protein product [Cyprideis torosa]